MLAVELGRAGIHHLEAGAVILHGQGVHLGQALDGLILEAVLLGLFILRLRQGAVALLQAVFEVGQMLQLVQEPPVDLRNVVDGLDGQCRA